MKIDDSTIITLSPELLLSRDFLYSLLEINEPEEKARFESLAEIHAKELGMEQQFKKALKAYNKLDEELAEEYKRMNAERFAMQLEYESSGRPSNSIDNFVQIIENDSCFKGIKYNLLTFQPEIEKEGETRQWTDADDSEAKRFIEKKYKIHNQQKFDDAMRIVFHNHEYHPVRDIVKAIKWDGVSRVETFLHKWGKCEDSAYTREVSRLIFAGLVTRTFFPGSKFDDMAVLVGKQGCGKSTLVRWLALDDKFFSEINDFEGQRAMEALDGCVVAEVSEMLAMTKTKEQEAVKSFLTRLNDRRRNPYDKRVTEHPRQNIFIGTSNKSEFIRDVTGGRRFYPIEVNQDGYYLFDHEKECKEDIRQCWAEAYARMLEGNMPAFASRELISIIRQKQENATEDDYRVGMIEDYLEGKNCTCVLELWQNALKMSEFTKPSKKDSNELSLIMQTFPDWEKQPKVKRFNNFGVQRWWKRNNCNNDDDELPM